MNLWENILQEVEKRVHPQSFKTWFAPTRCISMDDEELLVKVPNTLFKEWLRSNYQDLLHECLEDLECSRYRITFTEEARSEHTREPIAMTGDKPTPRPLKGLNPKYTFETFVVGSCNQFAHAAAMAVAEAPFESYNPLFVYGWVGLGKTHLMQAIGHHLCQTLPHLSAVYISSERFMNDLINSIRYDKTQDFRDRYRNIDVLLIDDIQFFAGKERTQEEFFHTFNALYEAQKQIVITSDCPPKDIHTLEERLKSRFELGLIADLQQPDLETKMAILKKKAATESIDLPDDVCLYIASHVESNIRELEGCLVRVIAYSSLTEQSIDLAFTKQCLRDILKRGEKQITVEKIQEFVAEYYHIDRSQILARNNAVARPRQVAMYLAKQMTDLSYPAIGKKFDKHHSTVIYACQQIQNRIRSDPDFEKKIDGFMQSLRR